ncbi:MAG TPA: hypothetical protein VMZ26_04380 [Pyrinomonadaceae bacterium]|nr:hypothetical protein [Pyrinomonadaceae bacterium]
MATTLTRAAYAEKTRRTKKKMGTTLKPNFILVATNLKIGS